MRIPVFFMALKQIDDLTFKETRLITVAIYRHAWLISTHLSRYSSLGNHTVTEAVGLVFAGAVFKSTIKGRRWLATGIKLLSTELPHQILDDGGPAEQSFNYHRFVLDLYWLALDFIHKNRLGNLNSWNERLSKGESFLNAISDGKGRYPSVGDSDDGFALAPFVSPIRGSTFFPKEGLTTFVEAGYTVIRDRTSVFTLDHGPLGMSPFYNHGHADALSITLAVGGNSMIVDSGTYRYNNASPWREYFKGTRAHNTVTIDGQDQALQETSFIWSHPYQSQLTSFIETGDGIYCAATHDGYMRLKNPVRHYRSIYYYDRGNFVIRDRFSGAGYHRFEINYHLHPDAEIHKKGDWWLIDNQGSHALVRLTVGELHLVNGQQSPVLGWYSPRYGQKMPTTVLTCSKTGPANDINFTTAICTRVH